MSGLLGWIVGDAGHTNQQEIVGSVVQSSIYGVPIPVIYGVARVGGNLIHLPHDPVASESAPAGGKLARTKGARGENIYTAPVMIGLCEGGSAGVGVMGRVWADKDVVANFYDDYANAGWIHFLGDDAQLAWDYLTTNVPAQALKYQNLSYVANAVIDLPGYHLRNYSWEVEGLLVSFGDALGSDVLNDILTDPAHGFGWVPFGSGGSIIGDLTLYEDYCAASGLLVSPAYTSQKPTVSHLQELLDATNSAAVWSDGRLKIIPFGDTALTGNGHTYTPNVTPLYDLDDDDYLTGQGEDPVKVNRKPDVDAYNQIFVEFEDRSNEYNPSTAEAKDEAAIATLAASVGDLGVRPAPKISLPLIKNPQAARTLAQLRLQREQNVRNEYRFALPIRYSLLEPMDLVTLTDINQGLSLTPVRIVDVTERDNEGGIDIIAEDWPFGTATASQYGHASGLGSGGLATIPPGNTQSPVIFNGPEPLSESALEIWIAVNGGPQWGGCEVWLSTDNLQYYKVGLITRKATYGTLTAQLDPADPLPAVDVVDTLSVDLTLSQGTLVSVSAEDFAALISLCYVDGEFLAYEDAALTAPFMYDLTTLARGAYGWAMPDIATHDVDSSFVLCDQAVFHLPFPQGTDGQTLWFKFPAFNLYGGALQDISAVTEVPFVIGTIPGPSSTLSLPNWREKTRDATTVTYQWNRDQRQDAVDVYENVVTGTLTGSPWPEKVAGVWPLPTRVLSNTASEITFNIPPGDGVLYAQVIPVAASGKPGRYQRATVTAVGTRPLIYGLSQAIGGSGLFTDVTFFVDDAQSLGGTLTAWLNHDSAVNADSSGPADGTLVVSSTPINPTPATSWNKTGGGTGPLLNNIQVHPGRGKLITFEFVNSIGVSSGKVNYTLTSEGGIIDESGNLLPGPIADALAYAISQPFPGVGATFPVSPTAGDMWYLTAAVGPNPARKLYQWTGSTWVKMATTDGGDIIANTIVAGAIAAGAITTGAIAAGAVTAGLINVAVLSDITDDAGIILAGALQSINGSVVFDLNATGTDPVFSSPYFALNADGSAVFAGEVASASFTTSTATFADTVVVQRAIQFGDVTGAALRIICQLTAGPTYGTGATFSNADYTAAHGVGVNLSGALYAGVISASTIYASLVGDLSGSLGGQTFSFGIANSGGVGFRMVIVPN